MRCSCAHMSPEELADPTRPSLTPVSECPQHGQRTPRPTTGTPTQGEGRGVPVVDITETIRGLLAHAEEVRERRHDFLTAADRLAASYAREADYLESIATTLTGLTGRTTT